MQGWVVTSWYLCGGILVVNIHQNACHLFKWMNKEKNWAREQQTFDKGCVFWRNFLPAAIPHIWGKKDIITKSSLIANWLLKKKVQQCLFLLQKLKQFELCCICLLQHYWDTPEWSSGCLTDNSTSVCNSMWQAYPVKRVSSTSIGMPILCMQDQETEAFLCCLGWVTSECYCVQMTIANMYT